MTKLLSLTAVPAEIQTGHTESKSEALQLESVASELVIAKMRVLGFHKVKTRCL
jgi:hypothetical protein